MTIEFPNWLCNLYG